MLAMSSPHLFSTINGWPIEEAISNNQVHNNYNLCKDSGEVLLFHHQLFPHKQVEEVEDYSTPSQSQGTSCSDHTMVKKLVHNASERGRRKKINTLFSSLRSLLPVADQMKKLSIPSTISRVLKYIPELQQQVEGLTKKKEKVLLRFSPQSDAVVSKNSQSNNQSHYKSDFVVSTSRLGDTEVAIQISCYIVYKVTLSEILTCLENDGFVLLNVSSFETFGGRVFYNLHFQVDKTLRLETEIINEKLLSIIEKEGNFL